MVSTRKLQGAAPRFRWLYCTGVPAAVLLTPRCTSLHCSIPDLVHVSRGCWLAKKEWASQAPPLILAWCWPRPTRRQRYLPAAVPCGSLRSGLGNGGNADSRGPRSGHARLITRSHDPATGPVPSLPRVHRICLTSELTRGYAPAHASSGDTTCWAVRRKTGGVCADAG
jgi:hypothetical protein